MGIIFISDSLDELVGYTNSNSTRFKNERKLISRYTFLLLGGPISSQLKQQTTILVLSIKAQKEVLWIAQFLAALEYKLPNQLVNLKVNNKGTILLTAKSKFHLHIKHIEI